MIDFVKGTFIAQQEQAVTVEVHGIGYRIFVPANLPFTEGEEIFLYTHLIVREDSHSLYGFSTIEERDLFRLLLDVSGIGPKAGLSMLSIGDPKELVTAIQLEDVKYLTKVPGVGKKTAQRLILDLKDKLKKQNWQLKSLDSSAHQSVETGSPSLVQEAIEALMGLGYLEEEAEQAVQIAQQSLAGRKTTTEELIRQSLQVSAKK